MFKHGDIYLMITSGCTGWQANRAEVFYARHALRCKTWAGACRPEVTLWQHGSKACMVHSASVMHGGF